MPKLGAAGARLEPQAGRLLLSPAAARPPAKARPQRAVCLRLRRVRKVQGTPVDPVWRLGLLGVSCCSADSDCCPGAREPRGPTRPAAGWRRPWRPPRAGPLDSRSSKSQPGNGLVGLRLGVNWRLREVKQVSRKFRGTTVFHLVLFEVFYLFSSATFWLLCL